MKFIKLFSIAIVLLASNFVYAQQEEKSQEVKGIRAEIIVQINAAEEKYLALIEATPQEKFSWRPEKDVRSIGEVFMHVAFGNYLIPKQAGAEIPKDMTSKGMEAITDKKKVAEEVKKSFEFARNTVKNTKPDTLDDELKFFDRATTRRGILYFITIHINQHLGQSIAYSRMNGIKPSWSAN